MGFIKALKAAGLSNPGRRTWHGISLDGVAVFTIWEREIRQVDGRWFAWWDHRYESEHGGMSASRRGSANTFIRHAQKCGDSIGRVVIVTGLDSADSAQYPHPEWARIKFLAVSPEALQFIAELLPL